MREIRQYEVWLTELLSLWNCTQASLVLHLMTAKTLPWRCRRWEKSRIEQQKSGREVFSHNDSCCRYKKAIVDFGEHMPHASPLTPLIGEVSSLPITFSTGPCCAAVSLSRGLHSGRTILDSPLLGWIGLYKHWRNMAITHFNNNPCLLCGGWSSPLPSLQTFSAAFDLLWVSCYQLLAAFKFPVCVSHT